LKISAWFTPSASANFAWVICRALLQEHADYFRDDWVRDRYFNVVVSWHAQHTAPQLNCNADMCAESRVPRTLTAALLISIFRNGAIHYSLNFLIGFQPKLLPTLPSPPARSCSTTRAPDTASTHPPPGRRQCGLGKLLSLCQKIVGGCRGCCPRLPWQHALIIAWSAVGVVAPALFCQNRLPSTINPC